MTPRSIPSTAPPRTRNAESLDRLDAVIGSIEAVANGKGAIAAGENGLGDQRDSYITNAATRNLLKGLVREARAALAPFTEELTDARD